MGQIDIELENADNGDGFSTGSPPLSGEQKYSRSLSILQRYQNVIIGGVLFLVALGFDLYRLGDPSIWFDEAFSIELSSQPLPLLWHLIFGSQPNMELYYLFLHFWLQITGAMGLIPAEFLVRLPSAIFAALSTWVIFAFGRRYLGLWVGIIAASLYLLNDLQLIYAQQTRAYSMQLLLICLAYYALFAALTSTTRVKRWWLAYTVIVALSIYAQLFSELILAAQVVAVAGLALVPNPLRTRIRKQLIAFVTSLVAIGILIIPMIELSRQGSKTGWIPIPHLRDIYGLFMTISANSKIYLLAFVALCGLGLLTALLAHLSPNSRLREMLNIQASGDEGEIIRQRLPLAFALLCWLIIPIAISYIVSQGPTRLFLSRYLVTIVPPLCLLVGLGVASLRWRIVKVVLAVALIALAVHYTPLYYKSAQVEDWNTAAYWLVQRYEPGDGMVCFDNVQGCQTSIEYYLTRYQSPAHFDADSPGAISWENNYGPINPAAGFGAAVEPSALAVYGARHPRLFFIAGRLSGNDDVLSVQNAEKWLDSHYHLIGQIVTPTVTIRLYATGG